MSVWWPIRETPPSSPDSVGSWAGQLASDLTSVCDVCGDLRNEGQGQITKHFNYSSGRQAAEAGCPFCDCLCQTVRHYFGYDPSNDGENIHTRARTFKIKISSNGPLILSWGEYDIVIYTPHGMFGVLFCAGYIHFNNSRKAMKRSGRLLDTGGKYHQLQGQSNRSRSHLNGCPNVQISMRPASSLLLFASLSG